MHIFISVPGERSDKVKVQCFPTDNIEELRDRIAQEFGRNKYCLTGNVFYLEVNSWKTGLFPLNNKA